LSAPRSYTRLPDGTVWPRLNTDRGRDARYGTPAPLVLADFVSAYNALVNLPESRRNYVIRALRADACKRDDMGDVMPDEPATPPTGGAPQETLP
jgi:hypothetical protein